MNQDPYPNSPKLTVATVTYNAGKTLQRTLESVYQQTYPNIEHLIIDGCSTDNTMELIHLYVDKNTGSEVPHEIKMIREPDKGLYDAMNKALENANGDYICFLNAGDKFHSTDTVEQVMMQAQSCNRLPAVLYGETDLVDNEGNFIRHRRLQTPKRLTWRSFLSGMMVCHQSFYVRTNLGCQEKYNLKYRFSADYDWCIRIMKRAALRKEELHNTRLVLTDYLNEGLTTSNHKKSLQERLVIMAKHYSWPAAIIEHIWFLLRAVIKK